MSRPAACRDVGALVTLALAVAWFAGPGDALVSVPQATLTAVEAMASDNFGFSVAMDGNTAVVGVVGDDTPAGENAGSARLFQRSGDAWTEQAILTAVEAAPDDRFGWAVAVSGDTAVVGVPFDDTPAGSNAGSVRVFVRHENIWAEQATLTAADPAEGDLFGFSVAVERDTALVGVVGDDTTAGDGAGSARVFHRSGGAWSEQATLTPADGAAADNLGFSVAVDEGTVVVGAVGDDVPGADDAGSAHVFTRSDKAWVEQATLTANGADPDDLFGYSVAVDHDTAVVGVVGDDAVGGNAGSARVFTRSGNLWAEQATLTSAQAASGDNLGYSVGVHRDTVVAGAVGDDIAGGDAGAARVFVRSGTAWTEQATITGADAVFGDNFGQSVAVAGHVAIVGAPRDNTADGGDAGAAAVVLLDQSPVAVADAYATAANRPLVVSAAEGLLINDSDADGDPLHVVPANMAATGTLDLRPDGSFTYTPEPGPGGPVTFTYQVSDGYTQSVVERLCQPPIRLVCNDFGARRSRASTSDGLR